MSLNYGTASQQIRFIKNARSCRLIGNDLEIVKSIGNKIYNSKYYHKIK